MKQKRKIIAVLLCLSMIFATSPATAFAAAGDGGTTANTGAVCTIGDQGYESLAAAFAQAGDGDIILLTDNVTVEEAITVDANVTLDLNGYVIINNVEYDKLFDVNAQSFTVDGSTAGSGMTIPAANTQSRGFIDAKAENTELTLTGGLYEGNTTVTEADDDYASLITLRRSGAKLVLDNVTASSNYHIVETNTLDTIDVEVTGGQYTIDMRGFHFDVYDCVDSPIVFNGVDITVKRGPCIELSGGSATFTDCDFEVTGEIKPENAWSAAAIGTGYGATVHVVSGGYKGTNYGLYIYSSGSNVTIDGGTFEADVALRADVSDDYYNDYGYEAHLIVNDGSFSGEVQTSRTGDNVKDYEDIVIKGGNFTNMTDESLAGYNIEIRGGSFPVDISQYVPEGNKVTDAQGNYTVSYDEETAVAAIGDAGYTSLQEALDDASGDTVTLLAPLEVTDQLVVRNDVTLDLGQNKLTSSFQGYAITVNDGKSLTIKNGTLENTAAGGVEVGCDGVITVENDAVITANGSTIRSKSYNADSQPNPGRVTFNVYGTLNSLATSSAGILGNGQDNVFNIDGATINSMYFGVYQNGSYGGAKVSIKNSTITDTGERGIAVYISNSATTSGLQTLVIENSVITGATAVEAKYTDVTIDGENTKLIATGEPAGSEMNNNGAVTTGYALAITHNGTASASDSAAGEIIIRNGYFDGLVGVQAPSDNETTKATVAISGGIFSNAVPEEYCADGFKPIANGDGTFSVHEHKLTKVEAVDATCTSEGTEEYWICAGCGKMYSDENGTVEISAPVKTEKLEHNMQTTWSSYENGHWHQCSACGYMIDEADHVYGDWTVTKEATADENGSRARTCRICGYEQVEILPATGTDDGADSSDAPKTGDQNNIGIWIALLALAGSALAGTAVYKRKK